MGVALTPAQAPGLRLQAATRCGSSSPPAQGDDVPAGARCNDGRGGRRPRRRRRPGSTVVDLLVPQADAAVLARGSPPATSPSSWTRGSADGGHRARLRLGLARRHHDCSRSGAVVAAPGAAGRGRPDRRLGSARRLLPGHPGVRRRADRAGPDRERPRDALPTSPSPSRAPQVSFVAGTRSHTQASALRDLWAPLAEALAELETTGQDVIVDAGRLGLDGSPEPLLAAADLTLLVTRTTLPALSALRSWADAFARPALDWHQSGVLLVGEGQPYCAREVAGSEPPVSPLADDPERPPSSPEARSRPSASRPVRCREHSTPPIAAIHSRSPEPLRASRRARP